MPGGPVRDTTHLIVSRYDPTRQKMARVGLSRESCRAWPASSAHSVTPARPDYIFILELLLYIYMNHIFNMTLISKGLTG
jgi:hypothetical protein